MAGTAVRTSAGGRGRGRAALALTLLAGLAACAEGQVPAGIGGGAGAAQVTELVETDVEAPEVFQVTEAGLWDGRPSLGGVWVAHPDVTDPERVIIRNGDTGGFVIGALFRRERDNPGPALQVSSDAAEALGMLAGAPASLDVTALRREEAAAPVATEAAAPVAVATDATPAAAVEALAPAGAVETTTLDAAPVAAPAPAAPALAAPVDPAAADAVSRATAAILASNAAAVPAQAAPASGLDSPYVQLGIFSIEANAEGTARDMEAAGLPARVVASTTQGAAFWRVLVGPAATAAEQEDLLARVRGQGFADAYLVRN